MNKIALLMIIHTNDWTAERAIIARNESLLDTNLPSVCLPDDWSISTGLAASPDLHSKKTFSSVSAKINEILLIQALSCFCYDAIDFVMVITILN